MRTGGICPKQWQVPPEVLHAVLNKQTDEVLSPEVAYQCLRSVPLYKEPALELLESIRGFLEIHSTLDYLVTPPPGFLFPAVDLVKSVDDIYSQIDNDEYSNEYDLQVDLNLLYRLAKDDHFSLPGDLLPLFSFTRSTGSIISLSEDGFELPAVYLFGKQWPRALSGGEMIDKTSVFISHTIVSMYIVAASDHSMR